MENAGPTPSASRDAERTVCRALQAGSAILLLLPALALLRPGRALMDLPFTEDGFLALGIARNIGTGLGITHDGVHATNGFQPLWVFLMAPAYAAAEFLGIDPLRLVLLAHLAVFAGTGLLLASTVERSLRRPGDGARDDLLLWTTAFLFFAAPLTYMHGFNGLETGLSLLLLTSVARTALSTDFLSPTGAVRLGAVLGAAVLARVDAALLVAALTAAVVTVPRDVPLAARLRAAGVVGGTAALVSSPWWILSVSISGTPVPTSAAAQSDLGVEGTRVVHALQALLSNVFPWIYAGRVAAPSVAYVHYALTAAAAGALLLRGGRGIGIGLPRPREWTSRGRTFGAGCALFVASLLAGYTTTSFAWRFYERYLAPVALVAVALLGIAATRRARRSFGSRAPRRAALATAVLAACGPVAALSLYYGGPTGRHPFVSYYLRDQLALVEAHAPAGDLVGAWQSGTLGYARPRVVNLDGKVNPEALRHRERMPEYLDREGVRWFCDWEWCVHACLGEDPALAGWERVGESGIFELWRRRR